MGFKMTRSISDYFAIWQRARRAYEHYATRIETEDLADEQFVIQQHAVTMMTKLPALSNEEVQMKIRVAMQEADFDPADLANAPGELQLMGHILQELDDFLAEETLSNQKTANS